MFVFTVFLRLVGLFLGGIFGTLVIGLWSLAFIEGSLAFGVIYACAYLFTTIFLLALVWDRWGNLYLNFLDSPDV